MSSTIKQAILSLKSRIADAYTAIVEKGGTLPATQDSASLHEAIESIPGKGDYDIISGIRLSDDPSDPSAPTRPLPDGMSLAQFICTGLVDAATKIADDNVYAITREFPLKLFPNVEEFYFADGTTVSTSSAIIRGYTKPTLKVYGLNTVTNDGGFALFDGSFTKLYSEIKKIDGTAIIVNQASIEEIYLPELESANCIITWYGNGWWNNVSPKFHKLYAPKLRKITSNYGTGTNSSSYKSCLIGAQCPLITSLEFEELESISGNLLGGGSCPNITELRMPKLKRLTGRIVYGNQSNRASLALIEVGAMETNLGLSWWDPADKGSVFLSNFKTYIAERLTDKGSGKTLTLSQEVRNAIHAAEGEYGIENIIITQKGWTISPAPN